MCITLQDSAAHRLNGESAEDRATYHFITCGDVKADASGDHFWEPGAIVGHIVRKDAEQVDIVRSFCEHHLFAVWDVLGHLNSKMASIEPTICASCMDS